MLKQQKAENNLASENKTSILKQFRRIPGIGEKMAEDLWKLGYRSIGSLKNENPEIMYDKLCAYEGMKLDRCVLYVFRCAVYYSSEDSHDPVKLKWWNWKD